MEKKYLSLRSIRKMLTFQLNSILEACLVDLNESIEQSLKETVCDFSVDYNAIEKSDILNIQKYLMVNNDIK